MFNRNDSGRVPWFVWIALGVLVAALSTIHIANQQRGGTNSGNNNADEEARPAEARPAADRTPSEPATPIAGYSTTCVLFQGNQSATGECELARPQVRFTTCNCSNQVGIVR
ncbi:MAG: hypothetical protein Kow00121_63010 [Elainellaceae cyanobacterium]